MSRLQLIMMLNASAPQLLEKTLDANGGELLRLASSAGLEVSAATRVPDDPIASAAGDRTVVSVDAVVAAAGGFDDAAALVQLAGDVARVLGDVVDWSRTSVAVGELHEILPTTNDDLLLVLSVYRLPTIDRAQFASHWLNNHVALALSMLDEGQQARMGYRQHHADPELSAKAAAAAGAAFGDVDGVLQVHLAQFLDLPHATDPVFAAAIQDDEQHFADASREMRGGLLRTLRLVDPAVAR